MATNVGDIQAAVRAGHLLFSPHATQQMAQQTPVLLATDVEQAILSGELVEDYPHDTRGETVWRAWNVEVDSWMA